MTLAQMEALGAAPYQASPCELHFGGGGSESVGVVDQLTFVPLTTRFAWVKDDHRLEDYVPGARGKLQVLTYVLAEPLNEEEGELIFAGPVMLTYKGLASKHMNDALKQQRTRVHRATQGNAPSVYFRMTVQVGTPRMAGSAGQQSRITPISLVETEEFDPDAAYIGDGLAQIIEASWDEYRAWADAWDAAGPNGDGEIEESASEPAPQSLSMSLPFKSAKYPAGTTVEDVYTAGDIESLKALLTWAEQHELPDLQQQARLAVKRYHNDIAEENNAPF